MEKLIRLYKNDKLDETGIESKILPMLVSLDAVIETDYGFVLKKDVTLIIKVYIE
mgnify:CR=1 FL=1